MVMFKGCNLLCKKRFHSISKQGKAAGIANGLIVSDCHAEVVEGFESTNV